MLPYPEESTIPSGPSIQPSSSAANNGCNRQFTQESISNTEDPFAYLKYFDTMFLIDDSDSMVRYWDEVAMLLVHITDICIEHDRNGIDIYFINHRPHGSFFTEKRGYKNIGITDGNLEFHDSVAGIFNHVKPQGKCRLHHALEHIWYEYSEKLRDTRYLSNRTEWPRPLNLIVITAGHVYGRRPHEALRRFAEDLDKVGAPPYQVGVQLFQVGDDAEIKNALECVDDGLHKEANTRDMVDTVTWSGKPGELSAEAVLKVVLGSVQKSLDELAA